MNFEQLPFEFRVSLEKSYIYQESGPQAQQLRNEGLSSMIIGEKLGLTDKTAKKAA